jgi:hypothetical protein
MDVIDKYAPTSIKKEGEKVVIADADYAMIEALKELTDAILRLARK